MPSVTQIVLVSASLLFINTANAYNVLVDFEDSPVGVPGPAIIESRGFNFSGPPAKGVEDFFYGVSLDGNGLIWCPAGGACAEYDAPTSITMTQDGLALFDLISLDLMTSTQSSNFYLTGYLAGGGIISTTVFLTAGTKTTFTMGAGWADLESLLIEPGIPATWDFAVGVDNIAVITAVPIPTAFWLFGSGLGLLGWLRRRQS
jgi:hypothetical protein